MRFPFLELLKDLGDENPIKILTMPTLTPREAWLLDQFLEGIHDILWEDYADGILAYQDRVDSSSKQTPYETAPGPPRPCLDPGDRPDATPF